MASQFALPRMGWILLSNSISVLVSNVSYVFFHEG